MDSVPSRVINLRELCPGLTVEVMSDAMSRAFESVYGCAATPLHTQDLDYVLLAEFQAQFSNHDWIYGCSCAFDFSCGDKFPWDEVHVELRVTDGVCRDAAVYTNAMDAGLSGAVK